MPTANAKMKSLVRGLEFETNDEYYEYCYSSYINGNTSQCRTLFKDMPRANRHELIEWLRDNVANDEVHNFYVGCF